MQYFLDLCNVISQDLQEILLVLDGTTGLNMLPQAREFNEVISLSFAPLSNMLFCHYSLVMFELATIMTGCWNNWFDFDKT